MRKLNLHNSINMFDALELKLSQTALAVGAFVAAPVMAAPLTAQQAGAEEEPLPPPDPPAPSGPGSDPPIGYPGLPPSGPIGPG
jgi:hypothetical protein